MDRKVLRDLWHLRGQVVAIALVIASGAAVLIMSLSTLEAVHSTSAAYYDRYRMPHVFATLKRAPEKLAIQIGNIPGVQTLETRIQKIATLDMPDFPEPTVAMLVSIPKYGAPVLNQLALRSGGLPAGNSTSEVVVNEPFALAHDLRPGDEFSAVLNGHRRTLRVSGIALSPEFIYSIGPGSIMPDDKRFGVLWMRRSALEAAYDLQESFNSISLLLHHNVVEATVIQRLDLLLARYGGSGAVARADQISNWFVQNEIAQMATMSRILPTIFLVIAAFLTNMVLGRLLATERSQIGLMKAFGYSNFEVGAHYGKIVLGICVIGIIVGVVVGNWFGHINTAMYADAFRFPLLLYRVSPSAIMIASILSIAAAGIGAAASVYRAVRIPPAVAMQPPPPPVYHRSRLQESALGRWLDQPSRIILRNLARWPLRSAMTGLGLSSSVALLVMALQWSDSLGHLAESYFFDAQRQHATVGLVEAQSTSVLSELQNLPGVLSAEPARGLSAELSFGNRTHRGQLMGVAERARLQPIYDDASSMEIRAPDDALVVSRSLAEKLGVGIGDHIRIEVLEESRPIVALPVAQIFDTYIGTPAYTSIQTVDRLLHTRPALNYANLLLDQSKAPRFYREVKDIPMISAVVLRQAAIDAFNDQVVENLMVYITMFSSLACVLGFGMAYNAARITLSERGRELATLRVLGFTRGETAYILLGEVGAIVVPALPIGCLFGYGLARLLSSAFNTELFRVPLTIEPSTYGAAVLIAIAATAASALIVYRRINRLNLIEVLKTRE